MTRKVTPWKLLAVACVALLLAACDRGPMQKAGKAVDNAAEKTGDKIKEIGK
jgi:predicted small secreted protein